MKVKTGMLFNYIRKGKDNVMMITEVDGRIVRFMTSRKAILDGMHKGHLRVLS
jgi:hypothetical protein